MTYIVDSSVAIKWFLPENLQEQALDLLYRYSGDLEAPDLLLAEVANVAWKKGRRGELSASQCRSLLSEVIDCLSALHPISALAPRALAIALELEHPVYDCVYVACAEITGRTFVTADERLTRAVADTQLDSLVVHLNDLSN